MGISVVRTRHVIIQILPYILCSYIATMFLLSFRIACYVSKSTGECAVYSSAVNHPTYAIIHLRLQLRAFIRIRMCTFVLVCILKWYHCNTHF